MAKVDFTGMKFGRLTAIERTVIERRSYYVCHCECGNKCTVRADSLRGGSTRSCGCLSPYINKIVHKKHGDSGTRLYKIYNKMISRCNNPNNDRFHRYGERGIKVCEEWMESYETFKDWSLSNGYSEKLSIDRIDNDSNYSPDNCRWTTVKVQSNNTSTNRYIEYGGRTQTLAQWCEELNYPYGSTRNLITKGHMTIEEIFTRPHIGKGFTGVK